jgi:hypothetical protein
VPSHEADSKLSSVGQSAPTCESPSM